MVMCEDKFRRMPSQVVNVRVDDDGQGGNQQDRSTNDAQEQHVVMEKYNCFMAG